MGDIIPMVGASGVDRFVCNGRTYVRPAAPAMGICIDGTAPAYLDDALARGLMPALATSLQHGGRMLRARAQMPTLTNVNNASIVTGVSAAEHGISGNHHLAADGQQAPLNDPASLRAQTILHAAQEAGVAVLAVTAKDKLRGLLGAGGVPSISAECADRQTVDGVRGVDVVGKPNPGIYDPALSAYAVDLAVALAERIGALVVYCSLTDYVQHACAPGDPVADEFFSALDDRLARLLAAGWRVGLVADHGMNDKTRSGQAQVRYLGDALDDAGLTDATVLLPITDPYVRHHGALGSAAYVYVDEADLSAAAACLAALPGVEAVLDRAAAAVAFELPEDRIGDLVVCADAQTTLGRSSADHDLSQLAGPLRSHGGLQELEVPLVVCQPSADAALPAGRPRNSDLFSLLLGEDPDGR